jgi:hypothetical protein
MKTYLISFAVTEQLPKFGENGFKTSIHNYLVESDLDNQLLIYNEFMKEMCPHKMLISWYNIVQLGNIPVFEVKHES